MGSKYEQGRIHGYPSRVRVGRSSDEKTTHMHLSKSSNAKIAQKRREKKEQKGDGPTDGRKNRQSRV